MMPLRTVRVFGAALALLVVVLANPAVSEADQQANAQAFVQTLGEDALDVLRQDGLTYEQAVSAFGALFQRSFDIPLVARFALGRYARGAQPDKVDRYVDLFEQVMVRTYTRRFNEYGGQTFQSLSVRPEGSRDLLVSSQFIRVQGPPVNVGWRLRPQEDGSFRVLDVVIENVSMALTQRNEYSAIIQRNGGQLDGLIEALEAQLASTEAG